MPWLLTGLGLFMAIHLGVALAPNAGADLKRRMGANAYRGIFSLLAFAGIALIVVGWQRTPPVAIYAPPSWGAVVSLGLMFLAVYAFGSSHAKTAPARIVRHPQLTAVVLWSVAHLLANGDLRSLILFTSLAAWAWLEMILINRRDGEWLKPQPRPAKKEWISALISLVVFLVLIALHRYYAGVSPFP